MFRWILAVFLLAVSAAAATIRLYLSDGTYQLVREYEVRGERVRFYSVERSEWEEIPVKMVDLKRTRAEQAEREEAIRAEAKAISEEEAFERAQREEIERVPREPGVYLVAGGELKTIKQAESKVESNKRRSVLKVLTPIPVVTGKATVELDGERSANLVANDRPEFYFRLGAAERFGIVRMAPKKNARVVQKWTIVPVTNEIVEEQDEVDIFRKQLDDALYKIWPVEPLKPGEYAVVEYTQGKGNVQVWDFAYRP